MIIDKKKIYQLISQKKKKKIQKQNKNQNQKDRRNKKEKETIIVIELQNLKEKLPKFEGKTNMLLLIKLTRYGSHFTLDVAQVTQNLE